MKRKAILICQSWHDGQWSALYQYASSGIFVEENYVRYIKETEDCLNSHIETMLSICRHNHILHYTKKQIREIKKEIRQLEFLANYFKSLKN